MIRNAKYYQNCPAVVKFGIVGKESVCAPETLALAVAIENRVSVIMNPRYRVYMVGEAVMPEGQGLSDLGVITRRIRGIEFERVCYADGIERNELHIVTNDGKFLAWYDDDGLTPVMTKLLARVRKERCELKDYVKYFEDVSYERSRYDLIA